MDRETFHARYRKVASAIRRGGSVSLATYFAEADREVSFIAPPSRQWTKRELGSTSDETEDEENTPVGPERGSTSPSPPPPPPRPPPPPVPCKSLKRSSSLVQSAMQVNVPTGPSSVAAAAASQAASQAAFQATSQPTSQPTSQAASGEEQAVLTGLREALDAANGRQCELRKELDAMRRQRDAALATIRRPLQINDQSTSCGATAPPSRVEADLVAAEEAASEGKWLLAIKSDAAVRRQLAVARRQIAIITALRESERAQHVAELAAVQHHVFTLTAQLQKRDAELGVAARAAEYRTVRRDVPSAQRGSLDALDACVDAMLLTLAPMLRSADVRRHAKWVAQGSDSLLGGAG